MRAAFLLILGVIACKPQQAPQAAPSKDGAYEVAVTEKGFEPDRIQLPPGKQAVLRFTRKTDQTCADAVEFQGDSVKHMLPKGAPVEIKVTAPASGELAFACPMGHVRGAIVVVAR